MNGNQGNQHNHSDTKGQSQPDEIRVTDRRRIQLNDSDGPSAEAQEPNLKPTYVEELEARTKAAEQKLIEVQSRFEQARAKLQSETDETRLRLSRAADERIQHEKANFIAGLLPVLDNLERAIEAAEKGSSAEAILDGLKSTAASFNAALTAAGVEPVASAGEVFNPETHEAVDTAPVEASNEGVVISEYARGYRIGDRLLRPARVRVGRAADAAAAK